MASFNWRLISEDVAETAVKAPDGCVWGAKVFFDGLPRLIVWAPNDFPFNLSADFPPHDAPLGVANKILDVWGFRPMKEEDQ